VDQTVATLVASQGTSPHAGTREATKKRLADAEARLRRFQDAIAAGIDPAALVDVINEAQAQRAAARAELDGAPAPDAMTDAKAISRPRLMRHSRCGAVTDTRLTRESG
jgi:uncharacterized protein YPO0396